jgi:hypothetical protein
MDKGLRTFEAAMLANIMPGDAQEAKAVIPSLDSDPPRFSDDEIQEFVDIIRNYRKEDWSMLRSAAVKAGLGGLLLLWTRVGRYCARA